MDAKIYLSGAILGAAASLSSPRGTAPTKPFESSDGVYYAVIASVPSHSLRSLHLPIAQALGRER